MAISDALFTIGLGYLISYAVLYRTEKLLGNLGFMITSGALIMHSTTLTYATTNVEALLGWFLLIASTINLIIQLWKQYTDA